MEFTKKQTAKDEAFYSSVSTWKQAYSVTLRTQQAYRARLNDLSTWDKGGSERERMVKITALQLLITTN